VRIFPVVPPPPDFTNWAERYQIDVNLRFVFENIDAHAWRYVLAAPLTLGMFFALPFAWPRRLVGFLRRELHWAYYIAMSFVVALLYFCGALAIGGIAIARLDLAALSPARRAKAEASA